MIYLRHFTPYDVEWLQKNFLIGYAVDKIIETVDMWDSKQYNGYPFEMYAISDNMKTVGTVSMRVHENLLTVSLVPEILPEFRRKGYAKFAMQYLIGILHQHEYRHLAARIRKDNIASIALHESLGYTLSGEEIDDEGHTVLLYELDTSDQKA